MPAASVERRRVDGRDKAGQDKGSEAQPKKADQQVAL
jgi:hypothetical protein